MTLSSRWFQESWRQAAGLLGLGAACWVLAAACGDSEARESCTSDDHCKGDRLCDVATGTCFDPPVPTGPASSSTGATGGQGGATTSSSSAGGTGGAGGEGGTGGVPFDPTQIADCVLWLRADLGITEASGSVSAWADQSGSGHDASQPTAANRPTYAATDAEINAQASLAFDGVDDHLAGSISASGDDYTLLLVGKITGDNDWAVGLASSAVAQKEHISLSTDANNHRFRVRDGTPPLDIVGGAYGGWHVFHGFTQQSLRRLFEDGTQVGADETSTLALPSLTQYVVGVRNDLALPATALHGELAEIIVYTGVISSSDEALLETYFLERYGL